MIYSLSIFTLGSVIGFGLGLFIGKDSRKLFEMIIIINQRDFKIHHLFIYVWLFLIGLWLIGALQYIFSFGNCWLCWYLSICQSASLNRYY
jgi:hypothetical protein